jgi:hypothetical protein
VGFQSSRRHAESEGSINSEDDEFNRIEREATLRLEAVSAALADQRAYASEYERGFIDGMQKQAQSSVDRAVNSMSKKWAGLTDEDIDGMVEVTDLSGAYYYDDLHAVVRATEAKLREKNT